MKTLLLMRHAKSGYPPGASDHARPLAARGRRDAARMGRLLSAAGLAPDAALCSTAARTRETLERAARAGHWHAPVRLSDALYEATPHAVLAEIRAEADTVNTLVVVGHEPTTSALASLLVGGGRLVVRTATVVRVTLDASRWADVGPGFGALAGLLSPGDVRLRAYRALRDAPASPGGDMSAD